uniref:Putative cd73 ecto-5'-nucleotidase n=1 Tax=Panstrongylus lignarius TaxID=156445 RepID=A0A224XL03_9HEMI
MYLKSETILWFFTVFITITILKAEFKLTLLHTNDMHSRIQETSRTTSKCINNDTCYGGFARLAYRVKKIKEGTPNTLFLNAGDIYQGTPMYSLFKWHPFPRLMEMLKIDAMSLGNHEFDDGVAGLVPYLQDVKIPVVTCNLDTKEEPTLKEQIEPWHMLTVKDVKIAVIGYLTPDTKFLSCTGNVKFLDEIEMIQKYATEAKEKGANLVFAVGHSGFLKDQEIAKKVADVDVVVGGHTDSFLYTGKPPDLEKPVAKYPQMIEQESGKKVPVVQAFGYTKYLGKLNLVWYDNFTLASATGNPILLKPSEPKDSEVEDATKEWIEKLQGILEQRKGATRVFLDGKCRLKECNFGNLLTDAITHFAVLQSKSNETWTEAPITLINGGSIRTSIEPTENVTWGDVLTALPFDKQIVRLSMKGTVLLKALHRSVERYHNQRKAGFGEFLQVSGMKVKYSQNATGHLVLKKATTRCKNCPVPKNLDLDPNQEYSVLTTLYVANGGDGYKMFVDEAKKEHIYDENDLNILAQYIEKTSPVYPAEEGRVFVPKVLEPIKKKLKS